MSRLVNNLKRCTRCGILKPLDEFFRQHTSASGRTTRCSHCLVIRAAERRKQRLSRQQKPMREMSPPLTAEERERAYACSRLVCTCCQQELPIDAFISQGSGRLNRSCRSCRTAWIRCYAQRFPAIAREHRRKHTCKRLGMTSSAFDDLLQRQDGRCAICGDMLGDDYQAIDHDHESGKVRGIVHRHCNSVIGFAHDDPLVLLNAADYVLHHHPEKVWQIVRHMFVPTPESPIPTPGRTHA